MSIRFSRIRAMTKDKASTFLVSGSPATLQDLVGWKAFESFAQNLEDNEVITVDVETFEYGEGDYNDATPEEIAYIYYRESLRPDFIESRTTKIGESSFVI